MRWVLPILLLWAAFLAASCTPTAVSPAVEQRTRGKVIYTQGCATTQCHGVQGEGIQEGGRFRDWPLVGEVFQRRNPTAQVVFDVVRSGGEPALRALTDQQVYDAIAYELSLNGVELSELLGSHNAPAVHSGAAAGEPVPGSLLPPPGNADLVPGWPAPGLPLAAENKVLRLRLTQMAQTGSIGGTPPPGGGQYALLVFTLEVLTGQPLDVGPQALRLETDDGRLLEPSDVKLDFPVARFYPHTIQPEHGAAALGIFALPASSHSASLQYILPDGQQLRLRLAP
jgi:mono/diheme cytochrome c family protein